MKNSLCIPLYLFSSSCPYMSQDPTCEGVTNEQVVRADVGERRRGGYGGELKSYRALDVAQIKELLLGHDATAKHTASERVSERALLADF